MFSGKDIMPLLSWGINITLGLHDTGTMDVSNLKIHEHKGLYLHDNKDYYTCDPLPEEWVNVISEKERVAKPIKTEGNAEDNLVISEHSFGAEQGGQLEKLTLGESIVRDSLVQGSPSSHPNDMNNEILRYSRRRNQSSKVKKRIYF